MDIKKKLLLLLIGLIPLTQLSFGQSLLSLEGRSFELRSGYKIEIYETPAATRPTGGFILSDSLAYIVGLRDYLDKIRLEQRNRHLDSLQVLLQMRIDNYNDQVMLLKQQLETEQRAFEQLQALSATKDAIAQDSIDLLRRYRRKGMLLGGAVGLIAGALWTKGGDSNAVRIAKPAGLALGGVYLGFTIFD